MMENNNYYKNIYKSICRLCLNYSDNKKMVSLIDENSQDGLSVYAKAVATFAQISLSKQDVLPKNMCLQCVHLLKQAIQFKLFTESSDHCLKQLKTTFGSDNERLKQKVIELTMLKFYFPNECFLTTIQCTKKISKRKSKLKESLEKNEKLVEQPITNDDSVHIVNLDTPAQESEPEPDISYDDKVLDKMENLIGVNTCKTQISVQKVFKRKKRVSKRMSRKARDQYNLAINETRMQRKDFVCNVCNRVLANQLTYNHHMQRHTGCRYICEHCGKGFPVLNELQQHQVTKHDTGPYLQCSTCSFKAPRKFDLIEHERIHSGERPYTCDKCGLTFRRRGIWKKHLIYHSEKKIQCSQCPKKFYQRSEMLAHANNIHNRVYIYSCSKCSVTYTKTETVRRHMTERHGIPRESQGKIMRVNKGSSYQEY